MKCKLCTCPNCMARYEAEAYQFEYPKREKLKALKEFGEVMNQINADWDARQADTTVEAPEFEVVEEPMDLGGKTYIIFGIGILALMYVAMDSKGLFG